jgi:hypothetical protein
MGNCSTTEKDIFIYDDYIFEKDLKLMKPIKYKILYHRRKKIYHIYKLEIKSQI